MRKLLFWDDHEEETKWLLTEISIRLMCSRIKGDNVFGSFTVHVGTDGTPGKIDEANSRQINVGNYAEHVVKLANEAKRAKQVFD